MKDKKLNRRLETFVRGILILGSASFVFQFLVVPGIIWNSCLYGFLAFSLCLLLFTKKYTIGRPLLFGAMLLLVFGLADLGYGKVSSERLEEGYFTNDLKIMTYNLSFRTQNLETNCSVIQQADPDILLVQELTPHWSEKLQASIGANYPYQEKIVFERARGLGIYSKFRIGDSKVFRNAENKPYAQTVELYISDKIFQLINVHLASPNKALKSFTQFIPRYYKNHQTRKAQLKTLKDYAEEEAPKFDCQFWVGDFNTMKYDPLFKRLRTHWLNTFDEVGTGRGLTFPNSSRLWPLITIDYILARGKAQCLESKVLSGGDSDHLAIMTKMKI